MDDDGIRRPLHALFHHTAELVAGRLRDDGRRGGVPVDRFGHAGIPALHDGFIDGGLFIELLARRVRQRPGDHVVVEIVDLRGAILDRAVPAVCRLFRQALQMVVCKRGTRDLRLPVQQGLPFDPAERRILEP